MLSNRTKLCMAAMSNGTGYEQSSFKEGVLEGIIAGSMEDWLADKYCSAQPGFGLDTQSDKDCVMAEVKTATYGQLLHVLSEMGFRLKPTSGMYTLEGEIWSNFIDNMLEDDLQTQTTS